MTDVTHSDPVLGAVGDRLYSSIAAEYDLGDHELTLLLEAAHTADLCADLQDLVGRDGLVLEDGRVNPAVRELRQQRLTLARLLVALRVPDPEDDDAPEGRTQRRGIRGVYRMGGSR